MEPGNVVQKVVVRPPTVSVVNCVVIGVPFDREELPAEEAPDVVVVGLPVLVGVKSGIDSVSQSSSSPPFEALELPEVVLDALPLLEEAPFDPDEGPFVVVAPPPVVLVPAPGVEGIGSSEQSSSSPAASEEVAEAESDAEPDAEPEAEPEAEADPELAVVVLPGPKMSSHQFPSLEEDGFRLEFDFRAEALLLLELSEFPLGEAVALEEVLPGFGVGVSFGPGRSVSIVSQSSSSSASEEAASEEAAAKRRALDEEEELSELLPSAEEEAWALEDESEAVLSLLPNKPSKNPFWEDVAAVAELSLELVSCCAVEESAAATAAEAGDEVATELEGLTEEAGAAAAAALEDAGEAAAAELAALSSFGEVFSLSSWVLFNCTSFDVCSLSSSFCTLAKAEAQRIKVNV